VRIRNLVLGGVVLGVLAAAGVASAASDNDPNLWLADIHGAKAVAWAKTQTAKADAVLKSDPDYARIRNSILSDLNRPERIPEGDVDHEWVYNFWQDAAHVRGLWRRTTIADYATKDPHWQTLLDVDKLDKDSGKNWVWKGADCNTAHDHCLVRLSPGGGDALEIREYNALTGKFIDGGFSLGIAKSYASYIDDNTVLFATDFGPGTLNSSGYPRFVKLWHRGEKIADARTVFEGKVSDVWAQPSVHTGPDGTVATIARGITFFTGEYLVVKPDGTTVKLPLPDSADLKGITQGQIVATLRDAWKPEGGQAIAKGALIAFPLKSFLDTGKLPKVSTLYTPDEHSAIGAAGSDADSVIAGRDAVFASIFKDVTGGIHAFRFANGRWEDQVVELPKGGSATVISANAWGPEAYFTFESFLTPPTLYAYDGKGAPRAIKSVPARFDAASETAEQHWATSNDGTKIPYFVIKPKGAKGPLPTILYSYGGFELSLFPWYWNDPHRPLHAGKEWVGRGGALVVANIRGGGEFGPRWHQAAMKYQHKHAFEDFAAVGRDVIAHGLTTPKQMGIVGASNGGLLVTATMVANPDEFGAVVCQRPLIDMIRYTRYGAGASWIDEYGDPNDAKMRAYIETYSPYQLVKKDVKYPPILFITETSDDRVTPIWARMMAAKMEAQGHELLFSEAPEGGHGAGSTHAEEADYWAASYIFFKQKLGLK